MTELVRIAPGALTIGRPLPWDVYDTDGNILLRQGYVIQTNSQLEQLFERGRFKPRKIERPQEEVFEDTRDRNPFADYPDLLHSLEATLNAITESDPSAQKRLLGLARMIERTCTESPDATLALVHLYSIGPVIHEQILFYAILCQFIGRQFGLEDQVLVIAADTERTYSSGLPRISPDHLVGRIFSTCRKRIVILDQIPLGGGLFGLDPVVRKTLPAGVFFKPQGGFSFDNIAGDHPFMIRLPQNVGRDRRRMFGRRKRRLSIRCTGVEDRQLQRTVFGIQGKRTIIGRRPGHRPVVTRQRESQPMPGSNCVSGIV